MTSNAVKLTKTEMGWSVGEKATTTEHTVYVNPDNYIYVEEITERWPSDKKDRWEHHRRTRIYFVGGSYLTVAETAEETIRKLLQGDVRLQQACGKTLETFGVVKVCRLPEKHSGEHEYQE